jgi:hypothetical protein
MVIINYLVSNLYPGITCTRVYTFQASDGAMKSLYLPTGTTRHQQANRRNTEKGLEAKPNPSTPLRQVGKSCEVTSQAAASQPRK